MSITRDRAEATATTVLAIIKELLGDAALQVRLADHLRDEFDDIVRMARNEIRERD